MGSILVTMPKREDAGKIAEIVRRSGIWEDILVLDTGSEVLRHIEDMEISLVICTRRLKDMGYEELYEYLPSHVSMLLLSRNMDTDIFSSNIILLQIPFKPADLINSIRMLIPAEYGRRSKKQALRSADDRLTIDKAKKILMERNSMTEPEAYRYLQKNSMDTGRSITETAQMILTFSGL